jgi:dTDP-glucose 4,6-dehydratase
MIHLKNILVTGGMGFIGSNFIRYMLKKHPDYNYLNLDKLTYAGNPDNLKEVINKENYKFVRGDICDKNIVQEIMKNVDAVVHFAAESHVDKSIENPDAFINTNIYGTYVLLEFSKEYNIKKFIMISTDEVYGSIPAGKSSKESDPIGPRSPYAASKASAECLAHSYYITYNLPVMITRSSNNFGPYQYPEKSIPLFITNLLEDKKVPLYGDGKNIRDWLYVKDNCEAIDMVLQNGKNGEIYNIAGSNEKPNIEIAKLIIELMDKDEDYIEYVEDRPGHDRRYSLNCSKIKNELDWTPKNDFYEFMGKTVEWYKKNEWWWKKLK